jgi:hypothetical protein
MCNRIPSVGYHAELDACDPSVNIIDSTIIRIYECKHNANINILLSFSLQNLYL